MKDSGSACGGGVLPASRLSLSWRRRRKGERESEGETREERKWLRDKGERESGREKREREKIEERQEERESGGETRGERKWKRDKGRE